MVELAHDVRGSGPLVVLVHGITEDRRSWDPITNDLAHDHRVLRVDQRGHGESPSADSYDLAGYAADLADLVDEPALLIGHSLGGLSVVGHAATHETRGIVDVDQPLRFREFRQAALAAEPALRGDGFADTMAAIFESFRGPLPDAEWQRLSGIRAPRQDVVLGTWQLLFEQDDDTIEAAVRSVAGGVRAPLLNLLGTEPPAGYADWLADVVPGSQVEVWDGHGHYPHLVDPERFLQRVRDFEQTL